MKSMGKCPDCQSRIGWKDAAIKGRARPFQCAGCGQKIEKRTTRTVPLLVAVVAFWSIYLSLGVGLLSIASWVLIAAYLVIDARYMTEIGTTVRIDGV